MLPDTTLDTAQASKIVDIFSLAAFVADYNPEPFYPESTFDVVQFPFSIQDTMANGIILIKDWQEDDLLELPAIKKLGKVTLNISKLSHLEPPKLWEDLED